MSSDRVIEALVSDLRPVRRLHGSLRRTATGVVLVALCVAMGMALFPLRADVVERATEAPFWIAVALAAVAFVSSIRCAILLGVPGAEPSRLSRALPVAAALVWAGFVTAYGATVHDVDVTHEWRCFVRTACVALGPLLVVAASVRRGAPSARRSSGLFAALAAVAATMILTQALCPRDGAGHVLLWHVAPVAAVALAGIALGPRLWPRR